MSEPIDWGAVFEWFKRKEIAALKAQMVLPSPPSETLSAVAVGDTNAVFIDGTGKQRHYRMSDFRPEYLIPMTRPFDVRWRGGESPAAPSRMPVAVFRLSTVQDGKAVYRLSHCTTY